MSAPKVIAIVGGSGSGKTTLAKNLLNQLGSDNAAILSQDSYYIDQSEHFHKDGDINFDHPQSLDLELLAKHLEVLKSGNAVSVPVYDFVSHKRSKGGSLFTSKKVIILDGTLVLCNDNIVKQLDDSIFIDIDENTRFLRRLNRDVKERGRTEEGVRKQYQLHVKPMHDKFVQPSSKNAHTIVQTNVEGEKKVVSMAKNCL